MQSFEFSCTIDTLSLILLAIIDKYVSSKGFWAIVIFLALTEAGQPI